MELQVAVPVPVPVPPADFNFDSACSSPYMTAPSSPQRLGTNFFFTSAPASPARISAAFYGVPFQWEDKPGCPKGRASVAAEDDRKSVADDNSSDEFEFEFSGQLEKGSFAVSAADELFDGGKIRPLKLPPGVHAGNASEAVESPRSPRSRLSQGKKIVHDVLAMSPRRRPAKDFEVDPFAAAIEETRKKEEIRANESSPSPNLAGRASRSRSRSLSPIRVSDVVFDHDHETSSRFSGNIVSPATPTGNPKSLNSAYSSIMSAISFAKDYRRWKLKDFLFRSKSEGRSPRNDDVLRSNYAVLSPKKSSKISSSEDVRNSSFRSTDSVGSVSSRRRGPLSAHEIHYTANRAVSEEMKRKTYLPYKQGLLGCLGFNPGVHEISRSFGSLSRA